MWYLWIAVFFLGWCYRDIANEEKAISGNPIYYVFLVPLVAIMWPTYVLYVIISFGKSSKD